MIFSDLSKLVIIKRGLIISLYVLLLTHTYIEVKGFTILYILLSILLIAVHFRETSLFDYKIDKIPFEFRVQKADMVNKKKELLGYIIIVLIFITPYFVDIPTFESRKIENAYFYIFVFLFGIILLFIALTKPQYNYFHFDKQFITGPGPKWEVIYYDEITAAEVSNKKDVLFLKLKKGIKLNFDFKNYYSERKQEELIEFLRQRGVKLVEIR